MTKENNTCHVPIRGTYTVDRKTGEIINQQLEYADIPADALAQFILERFGIDTEAVKPNGKTR